MENNQPTLVNIYTFVHTKAKACTNIEIHKAESKTPTTTTYLKYKKKQYLKNTILWQQP